MSQQSVSSSADHASLSESLSGRHLLVTGGTGFIGKALIAKLLRDVPSIERIYVLARRREGAAEASVRQRLVDEILSAGPLASLEAEHSLLDRIEPIEGDLALPDLGLSPRVRKELCQKLSVVVNCAGSVEFDGCVRVSTRINAIAPLQLLELARSCQRRCAFVHVSTAYVNGFRTGLAKEEPLVPDRSIAAELVGAAAPPFSLDGEVQRGLEGELDVSGVELPDAQARRVSVERARLHGWTDTYTFTKALGEQLLTRERGVTPVAIVRPSVVSSSLADPCPGWVEGIKVMDPLIVAYGKGQLGWFVGEPQQCLDVVPVDYVVNATLASIPTLLDRGGFEVLQVASGLTNPLRLGDLADAAVAHFDRYPLAGRRARGSMSFLSERRVAARIRRDRWLCRSVAGGAKLLPGGAPLRRRMRKNLAALDRVEQFADLYLPYVNYECRFDASRTEQLLDSLLESDRARFGFDIRQIDWQRYFDEVHIPGLRRYVLGESQTRPGSDES